MKTPKEKFTNREKWVPHPRYPWYHISNEGNIYNTVTDYQMNPAKNNSGYELVNLVTYWKDVGQRTIVKHSVHRLVAETYCWPHNEKGQPRINLKGLVVNHKDLDKTNNRAENLEWVTTAENIQHYYRTVKEYMENCTCRA